MYLYDSKMTLTPFLYKEVFLLGMRHAEDVNSKSSSFDQILGTIICGDEKVGPSQSDFQRSINFGTSLYFLSK